MAEEPTPPEEQLADLLDQLGLDLTDTQSEFDSLFPVVPLEDDPFPPDTETTDLVDDIADFAKDEAPIEEDEARRGLGEDFAFNWNTEEFYADDTGDALRVDGGQAVVAWAQKALNTRRGEYPIYSADYGSDLDKVIGQSLPTQIINAEVSRTIQECLLYHPRIVRVDVDDIERVLRYGSDTLFIAVTFYIDNTSQPVQLEVVA